ncbi:hypothetical protein [Pseudomonas sp. MAG733B]|uniref:DUF7683 domain-containing protein n=1 Tax=Pseudomonas sp. MAG733B TaxID=3122079 RepID=UPI0030D3BC93
MRFLLEAFDKDTDFQMFVVELPQGRDEQIKTIMGWTTEQQGWEGYNLSPQQLVEIEKLVGKSIDQARCYFQLTCNG